ncbi:unnamed protein product [Caenorhabditis sp. 36 PRJEB53466]|nr:unnamed protein product [Caenorhabditis sp. 36 PRJEB53466]
MLFFLILLLGTFEFADAIKTSERLTFSVKTSCTVGKKWCGTLEVYERSILPNDFITKGYWCTNSSISNPTLGPVMLGGDRLLKNKYSISFYFSHNCTENGEIFCVHPVVKNVSVNGE